VRTKFDIYVLITTLNVLYLYLFDRWRSSYQDAPGIYLAGLYSTHVGVSQSPKHNCSSLSVCIFYVFLV